MVLAYIYIYIYIYIYRVYVDSHSLGQLALASKRTASSYIFYYRSPGVICFHRLPYTPYKFVEHS